MYNYMYSYIWIIPLIIILFFSSFVSVEYSKTLEYKWFIYSIIINTIPLWPLVVLLSKSLIFDALLFDVLLMVCSVVFMSFFQNSYEFGLYKIIGFLLIIFGMILFKIG